MSTETNRRQFLQAGAAAGVGFWVSGTPAEEKKNSPLEKIRFGCIGIGGKGGGDTADASSNGDVVAICDVDTDRLDKAAKKYTKAAKFTDFRKLFDKMGKSIDAVTVSTPDHTHAAAAATAMRLGKHAFCQKPLTRTIFEARTLGELATKHKVATQMGNQGTGSGGLRKAAALIKAGALGTVTEVHVWTNRPVWPQGHKRPAKADTPRTLAWDLWLGPSKTRDYGKGYHPFAWRGYWDFGSGALGDMACHTLNLAFMALDLRDPTELEAESSGHDKDTFPKWSIIKYTFPKRGDREALKMTWYDGGKKIDKQMIDGEKVSNSGLLIVGTKGKMYSAGDYGTSYKLLGGAKELKVEYPKSPGHFKEWVLAMKGGKAAMSNFPDYASPLTETVLLGNLAVYAGKKITWDAKKLEAKGANVADLVKPTYRKGWSL